MTVVLLAASLLLLWAAPARPADPPCTIRVEGPSAIITCPLPAQPPPGTLPPPVVVPPPPACDPTPFVFPGNCPTYFNGVDRFDELGSTPAGPFYAGWTFEGSPGTGHICAGQMGADAKNSWGGSLYGRRLWVPRGARSCDVVCALKTGKPCP